MVLNSISNLNSLTSLAIDRDKETVCFPKEFLRNLTVLESLSIKNCLELEVLPEDLASLVTLKSLKIQNCPKLKVGRRREKGKGEDWYKIAHIPHVSIIEPRYP
ncbi:Disease resistance protein RGA2 [Camellia lanceoleosa]|uniref:Disease resistance protein RGA2 n=1 Tax=Camellia lanceoleosa TaxID=1840588 RepID=A0ACC0FGP4_9ERIC|nr:Disease resistance protein RGA2 [Camellia lanceoleosa]